MSPCYQTPPGPCRDLGFICCLCFLSLFKCRCVKPPVSATSPFPFWILNKYLKLRQQNEVSVVTCFFAKLVGSFWRGGVLTGGPAYVVTRLRIPRASHGQTRWLKTAQIFPFTVWRPEVGVGGLRGLASSRSPRGGASLALTTSTTLVFLLHCLLFLLPHFLLLFPPPPLPPSSSICLLPLPLPLSSSNSYLQYQGSRPGQRPHEAATLESRAGPHLQRLVAPGIPWLPASSSEVRGHSPHFSVSTFVVRTPGTGLGHTLMTPS